MPWQTGRLGSKSCVLDHPQMQSSRISWQYKELRQHREQIITPSDIFQSLHPQHRQMYECHATSQAIIRHNIHSANWFRKSRVVVFSVSSEVSDDSFGLSHWLQERTLSRQNGMQIRGIRWQDWFQISPVACLLEAIKNLLKQLSPTLNAGVLYKVKLRSNAAY